MSDRIAMTIRPTSKRHRWVTVFINALLVLVIAGLLAATWLPAFVGDEPRREKGADPSPQPSPRGTGEGE